MKIRMCYFICTTVFCNNTKKLKIFLTCLVIYHATCVSLCVLTSVSTRHVFNVICFNWH